MSGKTTLSIFAACLLAGLSLVHAKTSLQNSIHPPSLRDIRELGTVIQKYSTSPDATHYGLTLQVNPNKAIESLGRGKVIRLGALRGHGRYVIVDHGGGWHLMYGHLAKVAVKPGQRLDEGDSIGQAQGKKLFFVVSYKGNPINPSKVW